MQAPAALLLITLGLLAQLAGARVHEPAPGAERVEVAAGDEVVLAAGVHSEGALVVSGRGTAEQPVVVRPPSPSATLLRRGARIVLEGDHLVLRGVLFEHAGPSPAVTVKGNDNRVSDCRFVYCGNPRSTFGHIVTLETDSHRNRVDHCAFVGSKSMSVGLRIREGEPIGQGNRIDHNRFADIIRYWSNGQEAVQLGQGGPTDQLDATAIVEFNMFDNASGDAEIISSKSSSNTLRYNVAANCNAAFVLRGGNDCLVEGNVLVDNSDGIRIHGWRHRVINNLIIAPRSRGILLPRGGQHGIEPEDCLIAHNTIIDPGRAGIAVIPYSDYVKPARDNRIVNNLIISARGPAFALEDAVDNEIIGNLLWLTGDAVAGLEGAGRLMAEPRPEAEPVPFAADWIRDAAAVLEAVPRDRLARARPTGAGPDIGAEELDAGPAQVELPPLPEIRGQFDPAALRADPLPPSPGAQALAGEPGRALRDEAVVVRDEVPERVMVEWLYYPAALESVATLHLAAPDGGGYRIELGGRSGQRPDGTIRLYKGDTLVADGHDTVLDARNEQPEFGKARYPARLIRVGGLLRLDLGSRPVLCWLDTGRVAGPVPAAGSLRIEQVGEGRWTSLAIHGVEPTVPLYVESAEG